MRSRAGGRARRSAQRRSGRRSLRFQRRAVVILALALAGLWAGGRGWRGRPFPFAGSREAPALEEVTVGRVIDGDTVLLADGRTLRYLGIDAPEAEEPGHAEAFYENRRLAEGRAFVLELPAAERRADRHGRLLGTLTHGESEKGSVSAELVRRGHAWVYQASEDAVPAELLERLLEAQKEALERRAGVWARLDWTAARRAGLVSSRLRIHRPACVHIAGGRPRPAAAVERELAAGKSPCRTCRPLW
jgi:micrococcal nuclease